MKQTLWLLAEQSLVEGRRNEFRRSGVECQFTPPFIYNRHQTHPGINWVGALCANKVIVGWLCRSSGIVWEPIRKRAHVQLVREHLATVIPACWATVDWSWPKEWIWCARTNLHFKNKIRRQGTVEHSPKIVTSEEKATIWTRLKSEVSHHNCCKCVICLLYFQTKALCSRQQMTQMMLSRAQPYHGAKCGSLLSQDSRV